MKSSSQLLTATQSFLKRAADVMETTSMRPFRASDTARRLPHSPTAGAMYSIPNSPTATSTDSTSGARALPPPPV